MNVNEERFWVKVDKTSDSRGCWLWIGARCSAGYGCFGVRQESGKFSMKATHRISWMLANGEIPRGLCVLHKCDNPPCVNPTHLFLGTHRDNAIDREQKGRNVAGFPVGPSNVAKMRPDLLRRGESHLGSKLTEDDVRAIRAIDGRSQQSIADEFGVTKTLVRLIQKRRAWVHVTDGGN